MKSPILALLISLLWLYGCESMTARAGFAVDGSLGQLNNSPMSTLTAPRSPPIKDALLQPQNVAALTVKPQRHVNLIYDKRGRNIGFSLANTGSPKVNPRGTRRPASIPRREFTFKYPQRARQGIHLGIYEFAIPDGRDSHTAMYSSLYFFPRRVLPSFNFEDSGKIVKVVLPTGEPVSFDTATKEIVAGVLRENSPIDRSRNRRKRKFADLSYTGGGMVVRIDQRGEVPESEYFWGRRKAKYAKIQSGDKTCKVRANKLWHQGEGKGYNYFLFATDDEFRRKILIGECGWRSFQFTDQLVRIDS